ncbi:hypothetical protein RBG61_04905 [Paludicola sp. MB14-C6]|uniref:hypothetical protein n=1 Tax=Paludihabitans sp. MB14-C6 TaxID=3070656 RepID=UPI0027DB9860|nr:hypothetical protein [Paludicola sp. MB14-C6]WMJ24012.1 hypothetical protein RBG61_04905 [Paludicola sp. MB14-C6]
MGNNIIPYIKRKRSIIIAIVVYVITCSFLLVVKNNIYGKAIDIRLLYIILLPILGIVSLFMISDVEEKPQHKSKWRSVLDIVDNIIYICLIFLLGYYLYKDRYNLSTYIVLVASIECVVFLLCFKNPKEKDSIKNLLSRLFSLVYLGICVTTILFCMIVNPSTLNQAKQMITKKGYESPTYITNVENVNELSILVNRYNQLQTKNEDKLGYYFFQVKKEQKSYMVFVGVVNKKIVCEEPGEYDRISLDIIKNI